MEQQILFIRCKIWYAFLNKTSTDAAKITRRFHLQSQQFNYLFLFYDLICVIRDTPKHYPSEMKFQVCRLKNTNASDGFNASQVIWFLSSDSYENIDASCQQPNKYAQHIALMYYGPSFLCSYAKSASENAGMHCNWIDSGNFDGIDKLLRRHDLMHHNLQNELNNGF